MIPNYQAKMSYLSAKYRGCCGIAQRFDKYAHITELHHRCHNTKANRRKYPLFINSVWNLMPVNHDWHMRHGSAGKIFDLEALNRERFLQQHPQIAVIVNFEIPRVEIWD